MDDGIYPSTCWECSTTCGSLVTVRVAVTEDVPVGVLATGMGWWSPEAAGPERGALDININAAVSYDGPWDPISGSADTRGLPCRFTKVVG